MQKKKLMNEIRDEVGFFIPKQYTFSARFIISWQPWWEIMLNEIRYSVNVNAIFLKQDVVEKLFFCES